MFALPFIKKIIDAIWYVGLKLTSRTYSYDMISISMTDMI